jgi:hypothetical protein
MLFKGDCSPDEIAAIKHTDEALLARLIDEINASKSAGDLKSNVMPRIAISTLNTAKKMELSNDIATKLKSFGEKATVGKVKNKLRALLPTDEGMSDNDVARFNATCRLTVEETIVDTTTMTHYNAATFNDVYQQFVPVGEKGTRVNADVHRRKQMLGQVANHCAIDPSTTELYVTMRGDRVLNVFKHSQLPKHIDEVSSEGQRAFELWVTHFKALLGDDEKAHVLMSWVAIICQDIGHHVRWGIFLQGIHGIGKTNVHKLISSLIGEEYGKIVKNIDAKSNFNAYAEGHLLVTFEEADFGGGAQASEQFDKIKDIVVEDSIQVLKKGDDSITVPNFARVLVLSNKKSAIPIEPTERRFTVFFAPHKTRAEMLNAVDKNGGDSTTHFDDLHASVAYGSPVRDALWTCMQNYELHPALKNWDEPYATTELESLRAMNSSYCPWAVEINDLFDKGYDMINKDFVNTKALMEALRKDTADFNGTLTEIQEALKILKFTSIPQQASYNGKQRRVWARNAEKMVSGRDIATSWRNSCVTALLDVVDDSGHKNHTYKNL